MTGDLLMKFYIFILSLSYLLIACGSDSTTGISSGPEGEGPFTNPERISYYVQSQPVFDDTKVHTVRITIRQDYYVDMVRRSTNSIRHDEHFWMPVIVSFNGETALANAGMRIRGNVSTGKPKKTFKLKFNEQDLYIGNNSYITNTSNKGRRYKGLKRLNLRGGTTDASFMHDKAGFWLYKQLGYPAPRLTWAKLYITEVDASGSVVRAEQYKGLYLMTEDIDKTFLRCYFKKPDANLYKITGAGANFTETGGDIKDFSSDDHGVPFRVYRLKTNKDLDDYSDLNSTVSVVNNNWSNADQKLDFKYLARYFALNNVQGNWDEYIFIQNNYYFYIDPDYGLVLLPWDVENNFNMGYTEWSIPDFREAPLLTGLNGHWGGPDTIPLWDNAVTDSRFTNTYLQYCRQAAELLPQLANKISQWAALIKSDAITLHFNSDFGKDLDTPGNHWNTQVSSASFDAEVQRIQDFLTGRYTYVTNQTGGLP